MRQKDYGPAEELLLSAYNGLLTSDAPVFVETRRGFARRLADLYKQWERVEPHNGYAEKAEDWRGVAGTIKASR